MKECLPNLIETERCRLRPFKMNDLDNLFELYGDPEVMKTRKIGIQSKQQTATQLQQFIDLWRKRGFGLYAVFEKHTNNFVGECGFRLYAPDQPNIVEISYGLLPQYWGNGIATEIATAIIAAGFNGFASNSLIAHAQTKNGASQHILNRLGFERCDEKTKELPAGLARYELRRQDWINKWEC